jgi:hypothetical protein
MLKRSVFNIDFTEDDTTSNAEKVKGKDRSHSQKRAGTIIKGGLSSKKSKNPKYPICGIKGYILPDY